MQKSQRYCEKKKFKAKGFIEAVSMLAMAVPGTVLGVGYIRGFANGIFHTGLMQGLYGTGAILVIGFIVRSLPTGTRSGISALRQIDKSIEESAYDMGAMMGALVLALLPILVFYLCGQKYIIKGVTAGAVKG